MIVLGIESSCDETAASIVQDGTKILSSVISSQIDVHHRYGGVVPELASRMHVESISSVVNKAVTDAGIEIHQLSGVAATRGPGLIGALLVGFSFARSFAYARKLPFAGVNHLEAHIYSLLLSENPPPYPFVTLVVSGGHTNLYHVSSPNRFELMGQTRDDAAGEAFDKVAKLLDLGYPGGPVIEKLAQTVSSSDINFPRIFLDKGSHDFSFSGLKSAVARYAAEHPPQTMEDKAMIAQAFQDAVMDVLCLKLIQAAREKKCSHAGVAGGVSANRTLVKKLEKEAGKYKIRVHCPPLALCGDNAAMVAARGSVMIEQGVLCTDDHDVFSRNKIQ